MGPDELADPHGGGFYDRRRIREVIAAVLALLLAGPPLWDRPFRVAQSSEVMAALTASCGGCAWSSKDATAATLVLKVDGRYSQSLVLTRGQGPAEYRVLLGPLGAGEHRLEVTVQRAPWPRLSHPVAVEGVRIAATPEDAPEARALALAPVLHARGNTLGRYTDVPLVMWYETDKTERGTRYRYSVVFSGEDGGTPADRLMATWGRLTDIEYVFGVEVDVHGAVLVATYPSPRHEIRNARIPARGHPQLWVVTDDNMVEDHGKTSVVYAPAPVPFDLSGASREAVMDANPWTYRVSSQEAFREGRVDEAARPGSGHLPDPRRFVYVEACAETEDAALTFGVGLEADGRTEWFDSDGGQKELRIIRRSTELPNGCFRGAVALPANADPSRLRAVRFRAFTRAPREGEAPLPPGTARARLRRINHLFRLGAAFLPEADLLAWKGDLAIPVEGAAVEIPMGSRDAGGP